MDILKSKMRPLFFYYFVTASGSTLVASIFGLIDAMMVGQYHGPTGSAALAVFNPLWSIIYSLGLLAGIGGSVLFAHCRGQGDERQAKAYFTLSIYLGAALSVLAVAGIGLFNEPMFRFFGADDTLLLLAQRYLRPILFAIPCCIFSCILSAYLRNDGNPSLATKAVIIGGIFNVFGDYFCVFVLDMGISGAGLATATGQYIGVLIMLLHFRGKKNTLRLVKITQLLKKLRTVAVTGFSTAISDLALGIIGILFNRQIMAYLNADALSVYGIITQITAFAQCLAYGAGQAAQPIISQNLGAKQHSRIKSCLKYALYACAGMGALWTLAMQLAPNLFLRLFMTPTPAVAAIAPGIFRAYGLSYLLLPFNIFATYYFQAVLQPRLSMTASLCRSVLISGSMILLLPKVLGADSVWYAMLITEILVAAFSVFYMTRCTRELK